ncbi:MAG: AGE family epimerase/isomerase [Actinomycetaceae bacterium]|nr:AGE family epimerase/isomerase [Actinomycetaceae bacterium]
MTTPHNTPTSYETAHRSFRDIERAALIDFARNAPVAMGFGFMDDAGHHQDGHGVELWINGRFTHTFALEYMLGNESVSDLVDFGIHTLRWRLRDQQHGGWFSSILPDQGEQAGLHKTGIPFDQEGSRKAAYAHAFVILAASSALMAGHGDAQKLLDDALNVFDERWYEPQHHKVCESYDRQWHTSEPYRGINANMHTVECMLAAYDATGDSELLNRARLIVDFVLSQASETSWRIAEHYDQQWNLDMDYNRNRPADPFRPWGATVGHGLEWARLTMQTACALAARGIDACSEAKRKNDMAGRATEGVGCDNAAGADIPKTDGFYIGDGKEGVASGVVGDVNTSGTPVAVNPVVAEGAVRSEFFSAALELTKRALADGWHVDGTPGFVYTTDFDGHPIVHERMHWVVCEALNTANVAQRLLEAGVSEGTQSMQNAAGALVKEFKANQVTWWDYAKKYLIEKPGQWREELDRSNRLSTKTWVGKPEIYHAYQALILPDIDPTCSFAAALKHSC